MRWIFGALALAMLTSCSRPLPELPVAHSNNAVAMAEGVEGMTFYSFNGLRAGKTHNDVSKNAFACPYKDACRQLPDVPVPNGRLASTAVTVQGKIYLFGGYSVAEDGSEKSEPETLMFDPMAEEWTQLAPMPIPVDDSVAFVHEDAYIYFVSGWHDDGNVSDVIFYEIEMDHWRRATDYPGAPVFGHSGGAVDGTIVIADGVAVLGEVDGKRQFGLVDEAWLGEIDPNDPEVIAWRELPAHPGKPLYRMAAMGDADRNQIMFAGGGDNAYNITGVGYDGEDAAPSNRMFAFDLGVNIWVEFDAMTSASMDHRGLMKWDDRYIILGGLDADLTVLDAVQFVGEPPWKP